MRIVIIALISLALSACKPRNNGVSSDSKLPVPSYTEVQSGGVKMITVRNGKYKVWTKRVGSGDIKVLLLHGGPGLTHEYFECFENFLPACGIEFYYYDQLGSGNSDHPGDTSYINIDRFVDEVEEVRAGLGLDSFYLLGHSWGGMLAMEYAVKYPKNLKAVVISNMTASIPDYVAYINKLRGELPAKDVKAMLDYEAKNQSSAPEYQHLVQGLYNKHICRLAEWPEPLTRSFSHVNNEVYNTMQGNNEFVVTGKFRNWNAWDKLPKITCPALVIGADYDEMNPDEIRKMGKAIPHGKVLMCKGSHMCMYDDQQHYFAGLIRFLRMADSGELSAHSGDQALTYFE